MRPYHTRSIIEAESKISVANPELIRGKRVFVVEDGPSTTHGGMKFGAGTVAAHNHGAAEIIDPKPYLVGQLRDTFETYPGIGDLLPAMGYGEEQLRDLQATIANCPCDTVVIGTPIDLSRVIRIDKPSVRVRYDLNELGDTDLQSVVKEFLVDHFVS